jgi:hypothetical protein
LAIYIDIIARLNQRRLIKEGDELRDYMKGLEKEIKASGVRAAQGATKQLVKLDDALATSRDHAINKTDELTKATLRHEEAKKSLRNLRRRTAKDDEEQEKLDKAITAAVEDLAAAEQNLVYKLQAENKASRANALAKRTLKEETRDYKKNLRDVAKITAVNRKELTQLSRTTNKLRRDTENLHAANVVYVQDNKSISKSMEGLTEATKKVARVQEDYNELRKTEGVRASQIKAKGRALKDAKEAEARQARNLNAAIVDLVRQQRDHDSVIQRNEKSLRGLADQSLNMEMQTKRLRYANQDAVDQNRNLARQFDRVDDSAQKVSEELQKYHQMSQDSSVSSEALAIQIGKINKAFLAQKRIVKDSNAALNDYYKQQELAGQRAEERKRAREARDRAKLKPQSAGQYIARNIGALTPLGTLSPTAILPVAAIMATVAEAAVTASQSIALLPAVAYAATAGIATLTVGMWGFGDALGSMGDPEKFAEALYRLSPNAQQAALSLKNLVDGPLGDLKRATQDALFADVSPTLQALAQTFGPTLKTMMTSIATSFNQMFTGISFQFMTPETQQRVSAIAANVASMFDRIRPGVLALTNAFTKIAETGSGFLPGLADGFTNLMVTFDNFITRAQEDGSLQNFMQKGIDAVKAISKFLFGLGQQIYNVFGNKSPQEFLVLLDKVADVAVWLFKLFEGVADAAAWLLPILDSLIGQTIGWKNAVLLLAGAWSVVKLWQILKWVTDVKAVLPGLIAGFKTFAGRIGLMSSASAAVAASGAAVTSTAKNVGANTATAFAGAGTKAGKGFSSKLSTAIGSFNWAGVGAAVGLSIATPILSSLDRKFNEWIASKQDNPQGYMNDYNKKQDEKIFPTWVPFLSAYEDWIRGLTDSPAPPTPPSRDSFYKDWYPRGENPAGPTMPEWPEVPPGYNDYEFPLPGTVIDPKTGKALTESELLDKYRGELPRESYAVDPFTNPITGQKITPMLPMGANGMPEYPTGGTPGTPSIRGPVMPQYNSFGQLTGYGANMVDPQEVFDAQLAVVDRATDLEEANKDLLAAKQSGLLSEEEIHDLERKVLDGRLQLHKALVGLGKAQAGDVEKLKTETENARDSLGDFGAEIDKDFGISKGLTGIAENITKFLANLAFAPVFGAIRGAQAGLGFPQGEGAGSGLAGMAASSMGYYKNGPLDPGRETVAGAPAYAPSGSPGYSPNWYGGGVLDAPVSPRPASVSDPSAWVGGAGDFGTNYEGGGAGPARFGGKLPGVNLNTIPVAVQQYANNCINAAAQIVLSAGGVNMSQDDLDGVIARGGGISSLSAGLNRLNPSGGYTALEASGGSPDVLFNAVKDSIDRGVGSVLNVAPGSSIAGRDYPYGHFIAVTGYDPRTGRINLSDTGDGSMYSVTADEAFRSSRGRGLVAGTGVPQRGRRQQSGSAPSGPVYGPPLPRYANGGEVPIMAHSGEHVLTRDDVAALGGQAAVYDFRRSLHSYAVGGAVPRTPAPPPLPPALEGGGVRGLSGVAADMFGRGSGAGSAPFNPGPKKTSSSGSQPNDLGSLLGVGDSPPPQPAPPPPPQPPATPAAEAPKPPPLAAEAPVVPVPPAVPTVPETVMPAGVETPGTVIGAQVEAPEGYGGGLSVGGGLVGLAQNAAVSAVQAAGLAADAAGAYGGGSAGAAVASAAMQMGFEQLNRAIEYGGQVAAIGVQGLMETFMPAGGSELAQNNWLTRFAGGIAGAAPAMANLAGGQNASNQSTLAGVGGPPTPEQIATQGMDPNRSQHTGTGAPAGPYTAVAINGPYIVQSTEDRAGQDLVRHIPAPGAR